jgi:methionine-rich copper-binding protein CopC
MNLLISPTGRNYVVRVFVSLLLLLSLERAQAQPTIVSAVPRNGATGVPLSAAVILTFSEAMNTSVTLAYLYDSTTIQILPASLSWSAGNTVLTCTPTAPFPANRTIWWTVMNGQNPAGVPLGGYTGGAFNTVAGNLLTLTNALWSGGIFAFDVTSPAGQTLTVEYSSTLRSNQWQTLLTTNSPAGRVHIIDPYSSTNRFLFYRARSGS